MKIPNNKLQFANLQIAFVRYWATGTTFASDNSLRIRCNLLKKNLRLMVAIDDKIRDEKLKYDINREAAKILALLPGKIDIWISYR